MEHQFRMAEWARDKKPVWDRICEKYGGKPEAFDWGTWQFFDWAVGKAWPTISSITKARKYGWTRYDDTYDTWIETFRAFENAGVLPRQHLAQKTTPSTLAIAPATNGTTDHANATDVSHLP
jgi:hypothetical protein